VCTFVASRFDDEGEALLVGPEESGKVAHHAEGLILRRVRYLQRPKQRREPTSAESAHDTHTRHTTHTHTHTHTALRMRA
jgi:hypothetical protein